MANNRLYLLDKRSGERFLLAKSFGVWEFWSGSNSVDDRIVELNKWLSSRDDHGATSGNDETGITLVTENAREDVK